MSKEAITLSSLTHTWILDLDGTILKHNGYKQGGDELLPNAREFMQSIPADDMVVILTARTEEHRESTISFLKAHGIRFDHIIFNAPMGERVLINDSKPSGLKMSVAVNLPRDTGLNLDINIDEKM
ncbi:MAG: HAD family acid phosphatase [Clostridia bacterium]|nr:HAD family acid phosphatase [Clostridia bacterium]